MHVHKKDELTVIVDPCEGRCKGQHDIIVKGIPVAGHPEQVHATLFYGPVAFKSLHGMRDIIDGLVRALEIGEAMQRDGGYRE